MKRLSLLGGFFLAVACAHVPQDASVHVIINASDGAAGRVDTATLQRVTENEIRRASSIRPVTLTVFFDSLGFVEKPAGPDNQMVKGAVPLVSPQAVSNLSATPWEDGLIVQHGDRAAAGSISNHHWRREVVVGTYTISDDEGNVIEQRPVVVGASNADVSMLPLQVKSMRTTGHYLASRVAAVSK